VEGEKPSFGKLIKDEIKTLRGQLDKSVGYNYIQQKAAATEASAQTSPPGHPPRASSKDSDIRALLDSLSEFAPFTEPPTRRFFADFDSSRSSRPTEEEIRKNRNIHALLDALSDHLDRSDIASFRGYADYPASRRYPQGPSREEYDASQGGNYRALFDRLSDREKDMRLFDLQQYSRPRTSARRYGGPPLMNSYGPGPSSWEGYRDSARGPLPQVPKAPKEDIHLEAQLD